jgi:hypothetical protein
VRETVFVFLREVGLLAERGKREAWAKRLNNPATAFAGMPDGGALKGINRIQ